MSVRINGLDTHFMYRDVVDVMEQAGERLDLIMIPKVGTAADVYAVDMLVTQCETAKGRKKRIGFEMIIETALGMQNVHEIAAASRRNEIAAFRRRRLRRLDAGAHHQHRRRQSGLFGADRQGRQRRPRRPLGRHVALRHRPHGGGGARQRPAPGRRAVRRLLRSRRLSRRRRPRRRAGLRRQVGDPSRRRSRSPTRSSARARPRSPRPAASWTRWTQAPKAGKGAVALDGRLIDYASIRQAEVLVEKAEQIAGAR